MAVHGLPLRAFLLKPKERGNKVTSLFLNILSLGTNQIA